MMLDLRANFKQKNIKNGLECQLGCKEEETQEHLLSCMKIPESSPTNEIPNYQDLFSKDVEKQSPLHLHLKHFQF